VLEGVGVALAVSVEVGVEGALAAEVGVGALLLEACASPGRAATEVLGEASGLTVAEVEVLLMPPLPLPLPLLPPLLLPLLLLLLLPSLHPSTGVVSHTIPCAHTAGRERGTQPAPLRTPPLHSALPSTALPLTQSLLLLMLLPPCMPHTLSCALHTAAAVPWQARLCGPPQLHPTWHTVAARGWDEGMGRGGAEPLPARALT
jgi:hypothetical protein